MYSAEHDNNIVICIRRVYAFLAVIKTYSENFDWSTHDPPSCRDVVRKPAIITLQI